MELRYVQSEKESIMKCPNCGKEMRDGYLFCSKDGAFSFANEVPGVFENAKNADGFVKITELKPSHRTHIKAAICEACRKVVLVPYPLSKGSTTNLPYVLSSEISAISIFGFSKSNTTKSLLLGFTMR